ncbi:hypothetical protein MHPYR_60224 [uncultured Mycobacterium sp.]|uniref:Uncharacterized protein n=1 Tax=uncultured Mycobacterium sp. TaxID=171292 RepID=A0A1Y5PJ21_9MYCO|nr:hypothetical protein MHPYR_60224 [uncultured Mycobacterium sp.]
MVCTLHSRAMSARGDDWAWTGLTGTPLEGEVEDVTTNALQLSPLRSTPRNLGRHGWDGTSG